MDAWPAVADERRELVALCEQLTAEQWDAASLCDGWRVRDVVGHLLFTGTTSRVSVVMSVARRGFRIDAALGREGVRVGSRPTEELVAGLRGMIDMHRTAPGVTPVHLLVDTVVHQQDIRRPLGLRRRIPRDRLRMVLDAAVEDRETKRRMVGLRWFALDLDWTRGTGPDVKGTGEQLLMAMTGRRTVVAELDGAGKAPLAGRD